MDDNGISARGKRNFRNILSGVPLILDRDACKLAPTREIADATRKDLADDRTIGLTLVQKDGVRPVVARKVESLGAVKPMPVSPKLVTDSDGHDVRGEIESLSTALKGNA